MPYVPRRFAPTSSHVRPELQYAPPAAAPPAAAPGQNPTQQVTPSHDGRRTIGTPVQSLHTYEPNFDNLVKSLLGKGCHADPHTGELVLTDDPASTPANGQGRSPNPSHSLGVMFAGMATNHADGAVS